MFKGIEVNINSKSREGQKKCIILKKDSEIQGEEKGGKQRRVQKLLENCGIIIICFLLY